MRNPKSSKSLLKELAVGDRVQVFSWPNFGWTGVILKIFEKPKKLASEIKVPALSVKLDKNGEEVLIPARNVGVLDR